MNIEDILRKIVREELERITWIEDPLEKKVKIKDEEPKGKTFKEVFDDIAEKEEAEPVQEELAQISNTAELMAAIKDVCSGTPGLGKKAKEIVASLGYDKFSTVPDDKAQGVYHKVIGELK